MERRLKKLEDEYLELIMLRSEPNEMYSSKTMDDMLADKRREIVDFISSNQADRFQLPSDKQMIDIAILFNDGELDRRKLTDMVAYGLFIVDRLYENGDVEKPSSKEEVESNNK